MATIKQINVGGTSYDIKATYDGSGNTISSTYLKLSGGTMTGSLKTNGADIVLGTTSASSNDSGDLVWNYGDGGEKMRLWSANDYTAKSGPNFRVYDDAGTQLYSGTLPLGDGTGASGTWGISISGNAATLSNFKTTTTSNLWAIDSQTTNCIGYVSGLTKSPWNYQQTDGVLYGQYYSANWMHQIFGDYRTGQISIRGKNNGTWQSWRRVLDSSNYQNIMGVGHWSTTAGSPTGKIKININSYISWMLSFVVTLYQGYRATRLLISGYNYGTNHWYSPDAQIIADSKGLDIPVYFGYDSDWHLWVGFDIAQYTGITIDSINNGYTQINDYTDLFTITNPSAFGGTTQNTITASRPVLRKNITYGTGTPSGGTNGDVYIQY